ncbi:MAG: hypothetical protein R3E84_12815 [Pseudomonadales bacterium]
MRRQWCPRSADVFIGRRAAVDHCAELPGSAAGRIPRTADDHQLIVHGDCSGGRHPPARTHGLELLPLNPVSVLQAQPALDAVDAGWNARHEGKEGIRVSWQLAADHGRAEARVAVFFLRRGRARAAAGCAENEFAEIGPGVIERDDRPAGRKGAELFP